MACVLVSSPLAISNLDIHDGTLTGTSFGISGAAVFPKDEAVLEVMQMAGNSSCWSHGLRPCLSSYIPKV